MIVKHSTPYEVAFTKIINEKKKYLNILRNAFNNVFWHLQNGMSFPPLCQCHQLHEQDKRSQVSESVLWTECIWKEISIFRFHFYGDEAGTRVLIDIEAKLRQSSTCLNRSSHQPTNCTAWPVGGKKHIRNSWDPIKRYNLGRTSLATYFWNGSNFLHQLGF